ncbi:MAG TPA: hypothetical protein DEO71_01735 [Chryseobacterium sp.]|nr:hypothetical protein [Chryseobacterium sp.]
MISSVIPDAINIKFVLLFLLFLVKKPAIISIKSNKHHKTIQQRFKTRSIGRDIPLFPPMDCTGWNHESQ